MEIETLANSYVDPEDSVVNILNARLIPGLKFARMIASQWYEGGSADQVAAEIDSQIVLRSKSVA